MQEMLNQNIKSIIKVQAFIRRVLNRNKIKDAIELRDMYRMHARYFTREELFETLSSKHGINDAKVTSHPFTYANGARYEGTWLGGFRHGDGTMKWADKATYRGKWLMGYASGKGVFIDSLGN